MKNEINNREDELYKQLKLLEMQCEFLDETNHTVEMDEENETELLYESNRNIQRMWEGCKCEDGDVLHLLEQKLKLINELKCKKMEFKDEFRQNLIRQKTKLGEAEDEIRYQIKKILKDTDNMK